MRKDINVIAPTSIDELSAHVGQQVGGENPVCVAEFLIQLQV